MVPSGCASSLWDWAILGFAPSPPTPLPRVRGRGEITTSPSPSIGARHAFAAAGFAFPGLFPGSESMAPKLDSLLQSHARSHR